MKKLRPLLYCAVLSACTCILLSDVSFSESQSIQEDLIHVSPSDMPREGSDTYKLKKDSSSSHKESIFNLITTDSIDCAVGIATLIVLFFTLHRVKQYTKIAKAELKRKEFPKVSCSIDQKLGDLHTFITLTNLSDQIVAVQMNCNIKLGCKMIDYGDDYNGKNFWNMGPFGGKKGYIPLIGLFNKCGLLPEEIIEREKSKRIDAYRMGADNAIRCNINLLKFLFASINQEECGVDPELTMFINLTCHRENKAPIPYPVGHFRYDHKKRMMWIPVITDEKPVWEIIKGLDTKKPKKDG